MKVLEGVFNLIFFYMKLAVLHLLLSLCGLLFLGIAPANATILYLYQQYGKKAEAYHWFEAWSYFKHQFVQANLFFIGTGFGIVVFSYCIWFSLQFSLQWWLVLSVLSSFASAVYLVGVYSLYLTFQAYYEFPAIVALKLTAISFFLDWKSMLRWFVGTALCLVLAYKLPLLLVFFLPVVWLLFVFDSMAPIYRRIEKEFVS